MSKKRNYVLLTVALVALLLVGMVGQAFAAAPPPPPPVCRIGATQYATLDEALDAVQDGETITLLTNVTANEELHITNGKTFAIDPDGYLLDFGGSYLAIRWGTDVTFLEADNLINCLYIDVTESCRVVFEGNLNLEYSVGVSYQSEMTINGNLTSRDSSANQVAYESSLIVNGNVTTQGEWGVGVTVTEGSSAVINGSVSAEGDYGVGVIVADGSSLIVDGSVSAQGSGGVGVFAIGTDTACTINSNVTASYAGVICRGAIVTVNGNVTAQGSGGIGVMAIGTDTACTINGNITASDVGVECFSGAIVTVNGNVTVTDAGGVGVFCSGEELDYEEPNPTGFSAIDEFSRGFAPMAQALNDQVGPFVRTQVFVTGNISATGADSIGAWALALGQITVDGTIAATWERVLINDDIGVLDESTLKAGYGQYSDDPTATLETITAVWVKAAAKPDPEPEKKDELPPTGDALSIAPLVALGVSSLLLSCGVTWTKKRGARD